jgi:hypothetical protein
VKIQHHLLAQSCTEHESAPAALRDFNPAYVELNDVRVCTFM